MTDNTENRIRLAEAMGWKRVTLKTFGGDDSNVWESPDGVQCANSLPDPFTDANDDYAVLEWMRENDDRGRERLCWPRYRGYLAEAQGCAGNYIVGDYARAALKVLDYE